MGQIILTVILFGSLIAWETPRLRERKEKKEWIVFGLLMFIGFALSILFAFHMSV